MQNQKLQRQVHKVLNEGLTYLSRLKRGQPVQLDNILSRFTQLLRNPDLDSDPIYIGNDRGFLGVRYALVSWIDEVFTYETRLADEWENVKLEFSLYGTAIRNEQFWLEADTVERQLADEDALEAFYLCMALGFRGQHRTPSREFFEWADRTNRRVRKNFDQAWKEPAKTVTPADPPSLTGAARVRTMSTGWAMWLLFVMFFGVFVLFRQWQG